MNEEIGVLLDEENRLTSFAEISKIAIYKKKVHGWEVNEWIEDIFQKNLTTPCESLINPVIEIKERIRLLIPRLKDCRILLGTIIIGVPFRVLDQHNITMCEAEEYSEIVFNEIIEDMKQKIMDLEKEDKKDTHSLAKDFHSGYIQLEGEKYFEPIPMNKEGIYYLDLCQLQKDHPEVSSKKAIIPFLKDNKKVFYELQILCNHEMPWLNTELMKYGLVYHVKVKEDNKILVVIEHSVCK